MPPKEMIFIIDYGDMLNDTLPARGSLRPKLAWMDITYEIFDGEKWINVSSTEGQRIARSEELS